MCIWYVFVLLDVLGVVVKKLRLLGGRTKFLRVRCWCIYSWDFCEVRAAELKVSVFLLQGKRAMSDGGLHSGGQHS